MILLETGTPGTSREIHSEDAECETQTRNLLIINPVLKPFSYTTLNAIAGKDLSFSSWDVASLYIYYFSTVIDFSSKKYSDATGDRNSWYQ